MAPKNGVTTCSPCPVTSVAEVADADGTSRLRVTCKRTPVDPAEYLAKNVILATGAGTSSINITNSRNEPVPLPQVTPQLWAQLYFRKKPDVPCSTNTGFIEWAWQNGGNPMLAWGRPSINTQTDYDFLDAELGAKSSFGRSVTH
ncbi:unnamed protein product [Notodromas monacha]|uniref:Uncharacterized protein n=1 Tax=Notodromas monacha TaxID=399045 RepID=A0A7R9C3D1_9CRUS|nr:unnamed protein product [Notodromas monacha]CAG0925039.1 unnamed protein product [Notodromas monacha]